MESSFVAGPSPDQRRQLSQYLLRGCLFSAAVLVGFFIIPWFVLGYSDSRWVDGAFVITALAAAGVWPILSRQGTALFIARAVLTLGFVGGSLASSPPRTWPSAST